MCRSSPVSTRRISRFCHLPRSGMCCKRGRSSIAPAIQGERLSGGVGHGAGRCSRQREAVAEIGRGAFLAELAMLAKLPPHLTVTATSTLTVNEFGHDLLLKLIGEFPEAGARIVETSAAKLDSSMLMLREVQLLFEKAQSFSRR